MASSVTIGRAQLAFILCLPLAILLGYLLSDPLDPGNTLLVVLMMGVLSIPLLMRWHHPMLAFAWNAAIAPAFLPGQAFLWAPLAFLALGFAIVNRFTSVEARLISVPSVAKPLLLLLVVVLGTAFLHGGFGLRSFGSVTYGGRNYVYILAAIAGYFALVSQHIPKERANLYLGLFFLPGLTALVPNLAYLGGRPWFFLFQFFPPVYAVDQARGDYALESQFSRIFGLTMASIAVLGWVLGRYGLAGALNWRKPWPLFWFFVAFTACAFCGFRSILITFFLIIALQFWFEGLFKVRTVFTGLAALLVAGAFLVTSADKLPMVVQRSISFLPVRVSPIIELSSSGSTEWRLQMWNELLPQVPKYLLKGKGFGIDPTDLAFASRASGFSEGFEGSMVAGDYHSGPLSLIIPLGIWGVIAFGWFVAASLKFLYRRHRFGAPELRTINTFLLAYFVARLVVFIFVFGGFFSDLFIFTGLIGLSVSLNGATLPQPAEAKAESESEELAYQAHLASQRAQ
ncbi:MAG TPA: hypothetical protein VNZ64_03160 [Candidatus Acidoferrum sp.]|jgi:hypothetical protein|nr:hypothetical protein [Candidatus Acidoferrum sp.]